MSTAHAAIDQSVRGSRPIADYALLSDCNSAALVDRNGTIDWLCLPRFDSPAVLAGILDPSGEYVALVEIARWEW